MPLDVGGHLLAFLAGALLTVIALRSAVRTLVVPRGELDRITRWIYRVLRAWFDFSLRHVSDYDRIDRRMAYFAPVALLCMPLVWLILCGAGYTAMYWSLGTGTFSQAFEMSGSSLLTLGTTPAQSFPEAIVSFSEAAFGLILVALLISYLPTIYQAFSRREIAVTMLETRAGSPPSALDLLERANRQNSLSDLSALWSQWELWFSEVEETHTSLGILPFFRSPVGRRSWVAAAGTVLDTASLMLSAIDVPKSREAPFCIRSGYLALGAIATFLGLPDATNVKPTDPISISRDEFDAAMDRLQASGLPLRANRDDIWTNFRGWRVNYDMALLEIARLTVVFPTLWVSDRSAVGRLRTRKKKQLHAWQQSA